MQTRTYTERSNARRAARAAGVDPDAVYETEDGFTFPHPESTPAKANGSKPSFAAKQRVALATDPDKPATILSAGPEQSEVRLPDGKTRIVSNSDLTPAADQATDNLDIPGFLKRPEPTPEERAALVAKAKRRNGERELVMPKKNTTTAAKSKKDGNTKAGDKTAILLSMLKGKGSSVEQMTKALDWLPHTLRARLSRLNKPKSKGGEGLKLERERKDGVTTYRLAG